MRTRPLRHVLAGVVATVAALSLSGCGAAGPGVAAQVGDQTVTTSEVDRLTDGYCRSIEAQIKSQGQVIPLRLVRTYVAGSLTLQAAAEQLAEQQGIAEPDGYLDEVKTNQSQAGQLPAAHRDDYVEVASAQDYVVAVERQLGGQLLLNEGKPDANDDQKVSRGREELSVWLGDHTVDVNPKYGFEVVDGNIKNIDNDTSYPLSANALSAGKFSSGSGPDQAYTSNLPPSQRCG